MNKEQIDELLRAIVIQDEVKFYKMLGVSREELEKLDNDEQNRILNNIFKKLMLEIEKGDYEYFRDKLKENNPYYKSFIPYLISFSSKDQYKIELIEKRDEYGLDGEITGELISKIEDVSFKKKCIDKREEYNLEDTEIFKIIKSINEPDFTKKCIREKIRIKW